MLGHQDPSRQAEVLLLAKLAESLNKMRAESARVKQAGAAASAGGDEMQVVQSVAMPSPGHGGILQPGIAHIATITMHAPAVGRTERKQSAETGFTLIELLVVIAICLIMASFAAPIYSRILARSHEAVLKSDLFTMRQMIRRFTLDNHRPPESLDELVKAGYLSGGLPVDPFTGSNQTWQADIEDVAISQRLAHL